ncbi:hypothetical protein EH165_14955 [Nakamurella antarctica]|uniref:Methylamine utilisation protein MauE domain-containing protein n=1 Tax=Nakamurella antarctica TaxID=1902245 RepID=A0A3G8ZXV6_9ACTN|nr:MauE/DoxX family redox-associated membrane protein [Nakamurella antarctica]AZI59244.1 hypothetical protein EH165_14955 [Nakamurella antarctica]
MTIPAAVNVMLGSVVCLTLSSTALVKLVSATSTAANLVRQGIFHHSIAKIVVVLTSLAELATAFEMISWLLIGGIAATALLSGFAVDSALVLLRGDNQGPCRCGGQRAAETVVGHSAGARAVSTLLLAVTALV